MPWVSTATNCHGFTAEYSFLSQRRMPATRPLTMSRKSRLTRVEWDAGHKTSRSRQKLWGGSPCGGFHKWRCPHSWMIYKETPMKNKIWWFRGTPISGHPHIPYLRHQIIFEQSHRIGSLNKGGLKVLSPHGHKRLNGPRTSRQYMSGFMKSKWRKPYMMSMSKMVYVVW